MGIEIPVLVFIVRLSWVSSSRMQALVGNFYGRNPCTRGLVSRVDGLLISIKIVLKQIRIIVQVTYRSIDGNESMSTVTYHHSKN